MNHYLKTTLLAIITLCLPYTIQANTNDTDFDIFGFDPKISTILPAEKTDKTPVITVLGFPDPEYMYKGKFDTANTFTVTFRFHNTCLHTALTEKSINPMLYAQAFNSINIGQEPDATILLYVVAQCYRQGHKKVHIFGNSRGGATTIKMLDILAHPHKHPKAWNKIGISDPLEQQALCEMVAAGTVYVAHPLMNYKTGIKLTAQRMVYPFDYCTRLLLSPAGKTGALLASGINGTVFETARFALYNTLQGLLILGTQYSTASKNPIDILFDSTQNQSWPFTTTISLAQQDLFVGHRHEKLLNLLVHPSNGKLTIIPGGEHHFDIRQQIKDFRSELLKPNHPQTLGVEKRAA